MSKYDESLRRLLSALSSADVNIVLASGEGADSLQRLNITDDVANQFREMATAVVSKISESHLLDWEDGYKPEGHEIQVVGEGKDAANDLRPILDLFSDIQNVALFADDDVFLDELRFYCLVLEKGKKRALFFSSFTKRKELSRSKYLGVIFRKGVFDVVRDVEFLFDAAFACVAWEGKIWVLKPNDFMRIFGLLDRLRENGVEIATGICEQISIENAEEFIEACGNNLSMVARLASIANKDYLKKLTIDDLERVIKKNGLDVAITGSGSKRRVVFDNSPQRRWLIVKLLDDAYLTSLMTSEDYEVNSKRSVAHE